MNIMGKTDLFRKRIVWKIYFAWILKRVLPLFVIEMFILTFSVYLFGRFFFVQQIVGNIIVVATRSPFSVLDYFISSFVKTNLLNKGVVIIVLSFGVLILRDIGKVLASYRLTSKAVKPKQ